MIFETRNFSKTSFVSKVSELEIIKPTFSSWQLSNCLTVDDLTRIFESWKTAQNNTKCFKIVTGKSSNEHPERYFSTRLTRGRLLTSA